LRVRFWRVASPMSDVLSALDETFLELEELEPGALMNIGAILVFDPLPGGRRSHVGGAASQPYGAAASATALRAVSVSLG
jgi:hypothetical protein